MTTDRRKTVTCELTGKRVSLDEAVPAEAIQPGVVALIRQKYPNWSGTGFVCVSELDIFRAKYVSSSLTEERGELTQLESDVLRSLQEHDTLATNLNAEFDSKMTFGERAADKVASFGGSWRFIGIFSGIILVWVLLNSYLLLKKPFDPYPFILLNLVLSTLASFQAPIIMMSQNRQSAKDRLDADNDYKVNLKAELEIRNLHEKMDHLLQHQWQRLLEIQQIQTELVEELLRKSSAQQK